MKNKLSGKWSDTLSRLRGHSSVWISSLAWLFFFILILFSTDEMDGYSTLVVILFVVLWLRVLKQLDALFPDVVPALLLLAVGLVLLQTTVLTWQNAAPSGAFFLSMLHVLLLALTTLVLGLIIYTSSGEGKSRFMLFMYALVAQWAISSIYDASSSASPLEIFINNLLPFVVLFLMHLRRTRWLEKLTRSQCWLAFFLALFAFMSLADKVGVYESRFRYAGDLSLANFGLPYFYLLFVALFLLAVLVKLPLVMIYNHARLKRKLWIAGLLQSTFPQFIQLFILLIVFFYAVAGWQGYQVKKNIENLFDTAARDAGKSVQSWTVAMDGLPENWPLPGVQAPAMSADLAHKGVLALQDSSRNGRTFFLYRVVSAQPDSLCLIRIDNQTLDAITHGFVPLAGSTLLGYACKLSAFEVWIYRMEISQSDDHINISPFNIFVRKPQSRVLGRKFVQDDIGARTADWSRSVSGGVVVGRVLMPLYGANMQQSGFYSLDILVRPENIEFARPMTLLLFNLLIAYLLINMLVIRRMVKFGSEINEIIVRKFQILQKGIREIARGNLDYKVRIDGEDEFVELAEHFNEMSNKLKANIADLREKDRLESELRVAREVQLSLLPHALPEIPGYEIAADLRTATEVGGDFYDIQPLGNGVYMFTVGDVSGKSTSAAFYMAQAISLLRYSPQFTVELRSILARLNDYFTAKHSERHIFVTMIIGILDTRKGTVTLARAGHTEPVLLDASAAQREKAVQLIRSKGLGIGLTPKRAQFETLLEEKKLKLKSGDTLVLYTDGIVEASKKDSSATADETVQFFGEERFLEILRQNRRADAGTLAEEIMTTLQTFYGDSPLFDDYTVMVIRKK